MTSRKERSEKTARELFLEHAAAYFDDLKATATNAPHGQIFNHAEAFAFEKGRELLQQSLKGMLQEQIDEFEKKKRRRSVRNANRRNVISAITQKNA